MKINVTDIEPKEVVAVVKYLLKQGKFSDGKITNAVEKEAVKIILNTYEDCIKTAETKKSIDEFLQKIEEKFDYDY